MKVLLCVFVLMALVSAKYCAATTLTSAGYFDNELTKAMAEKVSKSVCNIPGGRALVDSGEHFPSNPCLVCDPEKDAHAWSVRTSSPQWMTEFALTRENVERYFGEAHCLNEDNFDYKTCHRTPSDDELIGVIGTDDNLICSALYIMSISCDKYTALPFIDIVQRKYKVTQTSYGYMFADDIEEWSEMEDWSKFEDVRFLKPRGTIVRNRSDLRDYEQALVCDGEHIKPILVELSVILSK